MATGLMRLGQLATGSVGPSISGSNISTRVSSRQSQSQRQQAVPPTLLSPALVARTERHGRQRTASSATAQRSAVLVPIEEDLVAAPVVDSGTEVQLTLGHLNLHLGTATQASLLTAPAGSSSSSGSGPRRDKASPRTCAASSVSPAEDTASSVHSSAQAALDGVPVELHCLLEPDLPVSLPAPSCFDLTSLDNSRMDRLVAALGRGRATWRRALMLYEWLKVIGHILDDRLCTTLIRVCADHGDAASALSVYEWMRAPAEAGGAGLHPTAYTYTAAMRAALSVGMLDRAMQVWSDSQSAGLVPDCRLCITYIELCTRLGHTDKALAMYNQMRDAPPSSPMRPSVHAYTAAMRAATEGGRWMRALSVWEDMRRSSCQPTGHAYAAAISACAAGQDWVRAVALFDDMTSRANIRPDVVSCTALVTALAAAGEADKAEAVVQWMQKSGLKPNVRTYTALLTAMGNARQWSKAVRLLFAMQQPESSSVQPNAYTYSALIKALGEHGQWQLAEAVFEDVESQLRSVRAGAHSLHNSQRGIGQAAPSAPHATSCTQQQPDRLTAFQRLMALAVAAEAAQQLSARLPYTTLAPTISPVAAGPAHVLQLLPLVDSTALSTTSQPSQATAAQGRSQSTQHTAAARSEHGAASMDTVSPISHTALGSPTSTQPAAALQAPLSPTSPMPIAGAEEAARNWSHPSELNGIQLKLLASSPDAPSPLTQNAPQPPSQATTSTKQLQAGPRAEATSARSRQHAMASQPDAGQHFRPHADLQVSSALHAAAGFSLFSSAPLQPALHLSSELTASSSTQGAVVQDGHNSSDSSHATVSAGPHTPVVNEVVCGAMMLAYERSGRWMEAVSIIARARELGLQPNTVMFNTAISAAGKAGQLELAEQLFQAAPARDAITYETMVAAYGMAGRPDQAEQVLRQMSQRGLRPRDYAYCGLVAAHSLAGNVDLALAVRKRMQQEGVQPTVHVYNALIAACERGHRYEQALELLHAMKREGVEPNAVTSQLCQVVGKAGAQTVESQQVAAAALSAVFAAAGGLLIRAGMF